VITYGLLRADFGLLSYSLSWLIQSLLLNLFYFWLSKENLHSKSEDNLVNPIQKTLVYEFSKSCVMKFFLSEGEKFVMIYMALLGTSAEYSLVAGLVGLICRFVFQPIEETSFILFAQ
jgi:oligosaccharide translocation protein RFT1